MLQCLYPLQQTTIHHFFDSLMDGKNQIIQAQVARALLFLQMRDSIQALPHQHFRYKPLPHFLHAVFC